MADNVEARAVAPTGLTTYAICQNAERKPIRYSMAMPEHVPEGYLKSEADALIDTLRRDLAIESERATHYRDEWQKSEARLRAALAASAEQEKK